MTGLRHRGFLVAALVALVALITTALGVGWYRHALADGGPASRSQADRPAAEDQADRPGARAMPRPADRPNIVFVLTDDLSTNLLPFMPHVQDLQRRGMTFSHYFVTNSLCCPSRSSILTGGHPHTTGVLTNGGADGGHPEFHYRKADEQTFATSLQTVGYTTAMMGKYLNGYRTSSPGASPAASIAPGWDEWYVPGDHDGYSGYGYTLNENGRLVHYGRTSTDYITDVLSSKGVDFIRRAAETGKPFLLEVSTFSPHAPYTPAPRHADAYPGLTYPRTPAFDAASAPTDPPWLAAHPRLSPAARTALDQTFRKRAQAVRSVDDLVADLVRTLEARGLMDDTYFVFSSDNGYHLGEHRLTNGKMTAFDTDVNVPLIVAGPGVRPGATSDALVANIDLCPTFQDLGGGARTALVDGRSLVPLLDGEPPTDWRKAVLIEHRRPESDQQAGPDREASGGDPPSYRAMRLQDALYVEYADGGREYYDLASDPYELRNLAAGLGPARRTALEQSLAAMASCRGSDACWAAATAAPGPPASRTFRRS